MTEPKWTQEEIARNKRSPRLPHGWGISSIVEVLRAHGPSVTRGQFLGAICTLKPEARLEVERRAISRQTKTRMYIRMEDKPNE